MKLRYYLRGLGIGMLVAALVLILSGNTGGKMSDDAVKRRAAELGMVEKDKTVLEDIGSGGSDEQSGDAEYSEDPEKAAAGVQEDAAAVLDAEKEDPDSASDTAPDNAVNGEAGAALDNVMNGESAAASGETDAGTAAGAEDHAESETAGEEQSLAEQIKQRAGDVADRAKEVAENSVPEQIVTFEVYKGDTSVSVSRRAKEAGLVESAADFDVFLCQNGYDKRISIGTYEITVGATEKEIADIVTKSR